MFGGLWKEGSCERQLCPLVNHHLRVSTLSLLQVVTVLFVTQMFQTYSVLIMLIEQLEKFLESMFAPSSPTSFLN